MRKHTYVSAERFILSREFFGLKLGLENITQFLDSIDTPQNNYHTIHLAGTNGKGSTAAMLASILQAQGYKTGLFTSPHLVNLRERIRVNGRRIPKPSVTAFVNHFRAELSQRKLSFFEVITAMGLYFFSRAGVDIAVVETGLGGRLDATNVLKPTVTVTTDISRDHVEILGMGLRKIAREKAGIIKSGVPHITGILPDPAMSVIQDRCQRLDTPCHQLRPEEFTVNLFQNSLDFSSNGLSLNGLYPALYGGHQLRNAALVVRIISLLQQARLKISRTAIRNGLAQTDWAGRFQVIKRRGKPSVVFDVCHNVGGITAFVNAFKTRFPGSRAHIITGFVKRKEHQKMFDLLGTIANQFHLVPLATRRSVNLEELSDDINWRGVSISKYGSLKTAYRRVLKSCQDDDIIAVVGSHFLVGEFFDKLKKI
ncbi:MAG: folylpolyglutamate synthase/dihydrofolate synthase family protein [candidate division Zixibacteria bacterium]|nr:folylpolyglutamate synthase/dihydrofolate synthase family protein [candidate division Zixibacteria bacterium]